ncbi:YopJ family acetyltransferase [Ralstonia pseudosolanacearum]|uniref:YopJ family acetyltransferase n=1 Tax=Ralstonia pseudosolanacearum TaxID=1310165 RepID=UPI0024A71FD5|nr:YopJ family acetyltransferase [Ralstonia pseudosolanacearum]
MDLARKQYPALTGYLERLEAAYRSNTTPDPIEDIDHLAAIIKGLNIADPMLNLHFDKICAEDTPEKIREYVLAQKLEAELRLEPRQRSSNGWREIIDDGGHGVAIDVRCSQSSNDVSIFLIESLAEDSKSLKGLRGKTWNRVLKTITSDIQAKLGPSTPPVRLRMTFFATNTRKSADGGSIFALSAAKKMASDPHIHGLQRITLRMVAGGRRYKEQITVADERTAAMLLPPSLYKHTTSKRVLEEYSATRPIGGISAGDRLVGKVNKKGQTLLERYAAHEIRRLEPYAPHEIQRRGRSVHYQVLRPYSNSYEAKRIDLIRTALAYLTDRPEAKPPQALPPSFPTSVGTTTATRARAHDPVQGHLFGGPSSLNESYAPNRRPAVPNVPTSTTVPAQPIPVNRMGHALSSEHELRHSDGNLDSRGGLASAHDTRHPRKDTPVDSHGGAPVRALPGSGTSPSPASRIELSMDLARKHYPALTGYLERLETAYQSSTPPDPIEDIDHMEAIIKGLNIADPMLNLHFDKICAEDSPEQIREYVFAKKLEAELRLEPRQRSSNGWREIIDDGDHRIAMGIQCSKSSNDVSILVIDSRSMDRASFKSETKKKWDRVVTAISPDIQAKLGPSAQPVRLFVAFLAIHTQKSQEGCGIFALSAAKKMASDPAIRKLHKPLLTGMATRQIHQGVVYLVDTPARLLPPSLYKHATSKRVLNDYLVERARSSLSEWDRQDGRVNKKGQTLLERYAAHEIQRLDRTVDYPLLRTYSNSYEAKRIGLIRAALASLTRQHLA